MNETELPLLDDKGAFIPTASILLSFATAYTDIDSIVDAHNMAGVASSSVVAGKWLQPHEALARDTKERRFGARRRAGFVVLEIALAYQQEGRFISLNEAYKRVVSGEDAMQKTSRVTQHARDSVRTSFGEYRNICHILAVWAFDEQLFRHAEQSEAKCRHLIGTVRYFEQLLDECFAGSTTSWNPVRMPNTIKPIPLIFSPATS